MARQLRSARHRAMMAALIEAREKAGLTQRELAQRLRRAYTFVSKIEIGERYLDVLEFCEYAQALGADAADLVRKFARVRK